jgi:hypothetical protein
MPENSRKNAGFFPPRCQQNCQQIVAPESFEIVSSLAGLLWWNVLKLLQIKSLEGQILPPQPLNHSVSGSFTKNYAGKRIFSGLGSHRLASTRTGLFLSAICPPE